MKIGETTAQSSLYEITLFRIPKARVALRPSEALGGAFLKYYVEDSAANCRMPNNRLHVS